MMFPDKDLTTLLYISIGMNMVFVVILCCIVVALLILTDQKNKKIPCHVFDLEPIDGNHKELEDIIDQWSPYPMGDDRPGVGSDPKDCPNIGSDSTQKGRLSAIARINT